MRWNGASGLSACFEWLENRRLLSAGELDAGFGIGGVSIHGKSGSALAMALQPGGKILIAEDNGVVERLNADGSPDLSFGGDNVGKAGVPFGIVGMAVEPDGKIVLGGGSHFDGIP